MEEKRIEETGKSILKSLFFTIKRSIWLILAVVILCTVGAVGYSYTKKPNYTASEEALYMASRQNGVVGTENVNVMMKLFNTVVDFCDDGVVVDRANFLYVRYQNERGKDPEYTIDEFIGEISSHNDAYNDQNMTAEKNILDSNVNVTTKANDNSDVYVFSISYTDPVLEEAIVKAKIYVEAFRAEVNSTMGEKGAKYFPGVVITITPLGYTGCTTDVSKTKIAIIGFLIGLVISAILVFIINLLDNTVKSKDELEELTGTSVLAYIEDMGVSK
ncbi:MAG: hypothetical protein E7347_01885 [Clostridiales bacterium]|nr:hypothetical protein [Clostridiales bacterium]